MVRVRIDPRNASERVNHDEFQDELAALTAMLFCAATSAFAGAKITIVTP